MPVNYKLLSTIHRESKKYATVFLPRVFVKYWPIFKTFYWHILQEIRSKVVVKYPVLPQTRRYTTLWNINVRKLACFVHCMRYCCWMMNWTESWHIYGREQHCISINRVITPSFTNSTVSVFRFGCNCLHTIFPQTREIYWIASEMVFTK